MNIVFTICSVNYLASAKCLSQSLARTNPDLKFVYVLADKLDNRVDPAYFEGRQVIEVSELNIPRLSELTDTYNIIEFNTAIKPYAVKHLAANHHADKIVYIDPDIIVFDSLSGVFKNLDHYDFILTPHILKPVTAAEFYNQQKSALNTGVFNLGFLALNYNQRTESIIGWWAHHMREHGHSNSVNGEFYDQKIMNFLPVFSDKVLIEKHPGYNVAGWNIHERRISKNDNAYFVNGEPLIFYHYSGLKSASSGLISGYNHLTTDSDPAIVEILDLYRNAMMQNRHEELSKMNCLYELRPNIHKAGRKEIWKYKLKKYFRR